MAEITIGNVTIDIATKKDLDEAREKIEHKFTRDVGHVVAKNIHFGATPNGTPSWLSIDPPQSGRLWEVQKFSVAQVGVEFSTTPLASAGVALYKTAQSIGLPNQLAYVAGPATADVEIPGIAVPSFVSIRGKAIIVRAGYRLVVGFSGSGTIGASFAGNISVIEIDDTPEMLLAL